MRIEQKLVGQIDNLCYLNRLADMAHVDRLPVLLCLYSKFRGACQSLNGMDAIADMSYPTSQQHPPNHLPPGSGGNPENHQGLSYTTPDQEAKDAHHIEHAQQPQ